MSLFKRITAAVVALSCMLTASGCGESTSWAVKYGDTKVNAGLFLYFQTEAFFNAQNKLSKENENLDLKDTKTLKTMSIDGMNITDWINNEATKSLRTYLAVEQKFDELGLSLTDDEKSKLDQGNQAWQYYSKVYTQNGIGEDSFKKANEFNYKEKEVFNYYYGEGGEFEYSEDDLEKYMEDNKARVKYIALSLKDGKDAELDEDGKAKIEKMANDYLDRAKKGENFDDLVKEYKDYADKLKAEAQSTDTTTETTPAAEEETTTAASDDSAETTTAATGDSAETTTAATGDSAETTAATGDSAETTVAASDDSTETTTASSADKKDETTTAADEKADTDGENADTDENKDDPYANEFIITKGNEEDGYQPSQVLNDAVFNDAKVDGDPILVKDEENFTIYVVQRYDVLERKDLREGDNRASLLWEILQDEFEAKTLEWIPEDAITKNKRAYKRYDPFNLKFQ